jgi:hypothetical protein
MRVRAKVASLAAAAFLFLAATGANADCPRPSATPPAVPDGASATDESMKAAHDALQSYVNLLQDYKACLKQQADSAPADTPQEQVVAWVAQGDAAVDNASYLAAEFSAALKQFKARQTAK